MERETDDEGESSLQRRFALEKLKIITFSFQQQWIGVIYLWHICGFLLEVTFTLAIWSMVRCRCVRDVCRGFWMPEDMKWTNGGHWCVYYACGASVGLQGKLESIGCTVYAKYVCPIKNHRQSKRIRLRRIQTNQHSMVIDFMPSEKSVTDSGIILWPFTFPLEFPQQICHIPVAILKMRHEIATVGVYNDISGHKWVEWEHSPLCRPSDVSYQTIQ